MNKLLIPQSRYLGHANGPVTISPSSLLAVASCQRGPSWRLPWELKCIRSSPPIWPRLFSRRCPSISSMEPRFSSPAPTVSYRPTSSRHCWRNRVGRGRPTTVVGLVRSTSKAQARFAEHLGRADFRLLTQDVATPIRFKGPLDYIIHAASQASPKYYSVDPAGTLAANSLGTHNVLDLRGRRNHEAYCTLAAPRSMAHCRRPTSRSPSR